MQQARVIACGWTTNLFCRYSLLQNLLNIYPRKYTRPIAASEKWEHVCYCSWGPTCEAHRAIPISRQRLRIHRHCFSGFGSYLDGYKLFPCRITDLHLFVNFLCGFADSAEWNTKFPRQSIRRQAYRWSNTTRSISCASARSLNTKIAEIYSSSHWGMRVSLRWVNPPVFLV